MLPSSFACFYILFTFRSFTISNLVFQDFYVDSKIGEKIIKFIISKYPQKSTPCVSFPADPFHTAPVTLRDPLAHRICDHAVVGGYTACHAHGLLSKETTINEHFNQYVNLLPYQGTAWPNYNLLKDSKPVFDKKCNSIHSYDVRYKFTILLTSFLFFSQTNSFYIYLFYLPLQKPISSSCPSSKPCRATGHHQHTAFRFWLH